jgi:hypothetical protein
MFYAQKTSEAQEVAQRLAVVMRKICWLECCLWLFVLGTLSWRQNALLMVHLHPYTASLTEIAGIIAKQVGKETKAAAIADGLRRAKEGVKAATAKATAVDV